MTSKFLLPLLTVGGATVSGTIATLMPSSPVSSNNANSVFIYKEGDNGKLIVGDGFANNYKETPLKLGESLVKLGSETWEYKNNSQRESIKNSFQIVGEEKSKEVKDWKEMIQNDEKDETNRFSGTATFYISKLTCKDLEDRFTSTDLSRKGFIMNRKEDKVATGFFGKEGVALWNCKQDSAIK